MIEYLESRIAPASLVDAKTVSYTDFDGDQVTVTLSADVLTAENVNSVFQFNKGFVDGDLLLQQSLTKLNLKKLGPSAMGLDVTIDVTTSVGDGRANVDFIDASRRDLGVVTVEGNLGRIEAGDTDATTLGMKKLDVAGLGKLQAGGGSTLVSTVFGGLDELHVGGDIREGLLRLAGGANGKLGLATIEGSLIGGAGFRSGAIFASGDINQMTIAGSLKGAGGDDSGHVGAGGKLLGISVGGDVTGGKGSRSGAILSTMGMGDVIVGGNLVGGKAKDAGQIASGGDMGIVEIGGNITGGTAKFTGSVLSKSGLSGVTAKAVTGGAGFGSGQIGTAGAMGFVTIDSLQGGAGNDSGSILATGSMGAIDIAGDVTGGKGDRTGHIGAGGFIANVSIGGNLAGASGDRSGAIQSWTSIGGVAVTGNITGGLGKRTGSVQAGGFISQVLVGGDLSGLNAPRGGEVLSSGSIGNVIVNGGMFSATVSGEFGIGSVSVGSTIDSSAVKSGKGGIGSIIAGTDDIYTTCAIANSKIAAATFIGPISATAYGDGNDGIADSKIVAGSGIATISAFTGGSLATDSAIESTTIRSGGAIGDINLTAGYSSPGNALRNVAINAHLGIGNISANSSVTDSAIISGINLGSNFISNPEALTNLNGTFNNSAAATLGFGGTGSAADSPGSGSVGIGNITLIASGIVNPKLTNTIILAGVTARGADGKFGTFDDVVTAGANIGTVSSAGGIDPVHVHGASIAGVSTSGISGSATAKNYFIAADSAGSGIGFVSVIGGSSSTAAIIRYSNFLSATGIGTVKVNGRADFGIADSKFAADLNGDGVGNVGGFDVLVIPTTDSIGMFNVAVSGAFIGDVSSTSGVGGTAITVPGFSIAPAPPMEPPVTLPGTGAGIQDCTFTSTGDIGHILGSTNVSGSGIVGSTFSAGNNIASITAGGATSYGIANSLFVATGMIGDIDADTGSSTDSAIAASIFQAGTDIGFISASARNSTSGYAIKDSGFNAGNDIAMITTTRGISGSVFVAGIHLGDNFSISGAGGPPSRGMGFGGTGANADVPSNSTGTIGDIVVTIGQITQSSFIAGIIGAGADSTFGTSDDATIAAAGIGPVSSSGGLTDTWFESGTVGAIDPGMGSAVKTAVIQTTI